MELFIYLGVKQVVSQKRFLCFSLAFIISYGRNISADMDTQLPVQCPFLTSLIPPSSARCNRPTMFSVLSAVNSACSARCWSADVPELCAATDGGAAGDRQGPVPVLPFHRQTHALPAPGELNR